METPEDEKEKEVDYPAGFEHVQEIVRNALEQVAQKDELIKDPPKDKGPQPTLKPPGSSGPNIIPTSKDAKIKLLEEEKALIKEAAYKACEAEIKHADKEIAKEVHARFREDLYPNEFKKVSKEKIKEASKQNKPLELSQDFSDVQLKAKKEVVKKNKEETDPKYSMSTRFTQSLGYTRILVENNLAKDLDLEQNKSDVTKEKETGIDKMSDRFSQSMSFNKVEEPSNSAELGIEQDIKEEPDPEPET